MNLYDSGKKHILDGYMAGTGGAPVLRALLVNNTYSYLVTHSTVANVEGATEVQDGGYSRQPLTNLSVSLSGSNYAEIIAGEIDFGAIAGPETCAGAVIFDTLGAEGPTNPLLAFAAIGTPVAFNGQTFIVKFDGANPGGFYRLTE